nr:hypothetical protein BaRGS_024715 [Batillaria attramentaria]
MMGVWRDLGNYLTRPIIPFCFGVPLLLPAALLVAVAFLQDDYATTLRVLGLVLLSLSVFSISWGTVLGIYDLRKKRRRKDKPANKTLLVKEATPREAKSRFNSPPISASSSRSGSITSVRSEGSVGLLVTNEKTRLFQHSSKKRRKNRLVRNIVFPTKKLPSLKEEDHLSPKGPESNREASASTRSAENMKKLEEYLQSLGLEARGMDVSQIPTTQATVAGSGGKGSGMDRLTVKQQAELLRSKSLPEGGFQALAGSQGKAHANGTASLTVFQPRPQQRWVLF